ASVAATGVHLGEPVGTAACARCHPAVVAQWTPSAHRFASFANPYYVASVEAFRAERGFEASTFCGDCHDPLIVAGGKMLAPIDRGTVEAQAGLTCLVCHAIDAPDQAGNGAFQAHVSGPRPGPEHRAHVARPALRTPTLCASCHRVGLTEAVTADRWFRGQDEYGDWRDSGWSGRGAPSIWRPPEVRACVDCHMPRVPVGPEEKGTVAGRIRSHRFAAANAALARLAQDEAQAAAVAASLAGAVSVALQDGGDGRVDVVMRNLAVGHRFPGGTRDSHDTRVEVDLRAADGRLLARTTDPHRLRSAVLGDDGQPRLAREVEALRVGAFDHTVAPRDAVVVRFAVDVPDDLDADAWPLRLEARLVHRSRSEELVEATCAAGKSAPGRAFVRRSREASGDPLDPCAPPPATVIAASAVELGRGASTLSERPTWSRLYELGLGLEHEVQERLDRARRAYDAALEACGDDPEATAMILAGLAAVAARQGRVDDALDLTRQIAEVAPELADAPALDVLRGRALAAVWRWPTAVGPLEAVVAAFKGDPLAWRELGLARGSAGDRLGALEAAREGLTLTPRDPDLLRVQALALRELAHPGADEAMEAYLRHRTADFGPGLRARCSRESPACARERLPVHTHTLEPVEPK
ncbi:MAG: hypothetical protein KC486_29020, partial [Myxococcales bacterium]|nr:hypothetical protein [Myxococcales bacterium]